MNARGPYAKGSAKRAEILDVALDVVAERGCRRAYVSEIAQRAGLTQAGLMHHFRSREELYEAVIRVRDEHDQATIAAEPPGIEGFLAVIEHNRQVPGLVQLYVEFSAEAAHSDHQSRGFFRDRYAELRGALERDIAFAQAEGRMGEHIDTVAAADLMIAAADGLQLQWLMDDTVDMVARLQELWRTLSVASWHPVAI